MDCPDRKGLVARVAGLLYEWGANILHADQHQDHELGLFFMRVEWGLGNGGRCADSPLASTWTGFKLAFAPLAAELEMRWKLSASDREAEGGAVLLAIPALHGGPAASLAQRRVGLRDSSHRFESSRGRESSCVLRDSLRTDAC